MPPDFENLPTPSDMTKKDEDSIFEKKIEEQITESSTEASSVEESLLKKIQKK